MDSQGNTHVFGPMGGADVEYPVWGAPVHRLELMRGANGAVSSVLWRDPSGDWRQFDFHGILQAMGDRVGNVITFDYDDAGRLIRVQSYNTPDRYIDLFYEDGERPHLLTRVEDNFGREVRYGFDSGARDPRLGRATSCLNPRASYAAALRSHCAGFSR